MRWRHGCCSLGGVNRFTRSSARACAALLAVASFTVGADRAEARGLLSPLKDTRVQVTGEEVATTFGADHTTSWTRLDASSGGFVWLIPLPPGARADLGSDAWLAALDVAYATRIVPPVAPAPCNALAGAEVSTTAAHGARLSPSDARILFGDADLATYGADLELDGETTTAAHSAFLAGAALLALRFGPTQGPVRTPTVRVSWPSAANGSPSTSVGAGVHPSFSTVYAIGPGPAAFGGAPVLLGAVAPPEITWGARGSNYPTVRWNALVGAGEGRFLIESASHRGLFVARTDESLTIPSVAGSYFGPDTCSLASQLLVTSNARMSHTCAAGALAWFGGASCDEGVLPGESDAHTLRCGGDDFALALSNATPATLAVTRAVTTGDSAANVVLGGLEQSTVVASLEYDLACRTAGESPGSVGGFGGATVGSSGGGGDFGSSDSVDPSADVGVAVDTSGDSCDSSSSGSDSSSSDSCDSSSDSSSGDGCGGDSGGGGDGCSGGGGGGGEGCSGGGGGGGDCSAARRGHGRKNPVSRVALGAVALLLVWRRRSRARASLSTD